MVSAAKAGTRRRAVRRPPRTEAVGEPNTPGPARMWFLTDWQQASENWYEQGANDGWLNKNSAKAAVLGRATPGGATAERQSS
jgi:hypothetical protein